MTKSFSVCLGAALLGGYIASNWAFYDIQTKRTSSFRSGISSDELSQVRGGSGVCFVHDISGCPIPPPSMQCFDDCELEVCTEGFCLFTCTKELHRLRRVPYALADEDDTGARGLDNLPTYWCNPEKECDHYCSYFQDEWRCTKGDEIVSESTPVTPLVPNNLECPPYALIAQISSEMVPLAQANGLYFRLSDN